MNLLVSVNSKEELIKVIEKDIYGVILYLDKLSVNSSFYIDIDFLSSINFKNKKIYLMMNKIMHNSDLILVEETLRKLKLMDVKIFYYDMGVYDIAKNLEMLDKLIIYQDHLNTSIYSNNFYYDMGINESYISSDITKEELNDIKNNTSMKVYFTLYGYVPIFYSRRYLISNYLKFIGKEKDNSEYTIKSDTGDIYKICEEEFGTTIYSKEPVNLTNYLDDLKDIDYLVIHGNMVDNILEVVDKIVNHETFDDYYEGFFNTKTIYRVKGEQ